MHISPSVAPGAFGVGLLEAVPEKTIVGGPTGRRGRRRGPGGLNRVVDARARTRALGRFGWKANVPTVEQQNAGAFNGDIGITSPIFTDENARPASAPAPGRRPAAGRRSTSASSPG